MEKIKTFIIKHYRVLIIILTFIIALALVLSVYFETRKKRLADQQNNGEQSQDDYPVGFTNTEDGKLRITADGSKKADFVWKVVDYSEDYIGIENEGETDGKISLLVSSKKAGSATIVLNRVAPDDENNLAASLTISVFIKEEDDGSLTLLSGLVSVYTRESSVLGDICDIVMEGSIVNFIFNSKLDNISAKSDNEEVAIVSSPKIDAEKDGEKGWNINSTSYYISSVADGEVTITFYAKGIDLAEEEEYIKKMEDFDTATDDAAEKANLEERKKDYERDLPEFKARYEEHKALIEKYGESAYATIDMQIKYKVEGGQFIFIESIENAGGPVMEMTDEEMELFK